jgi:hypothetical protein
MHAQTIIASVILVIGIILIIIAYALYPVEEAPVKDKPTTETDAAFEARKVAFEGSTAVAKRASEAFNKQGLLISGFTIFGMAAGFLIGETLGCFPASESAAYYDF